ncbi:MAG: 3-oxoacyl-[acyl-carrier protein] reductase, partial [Flavobacteriales bacterium]
MEINNSRVLITGGSSGIGKETAKQFVARGAKVVITGRDENKLKKVADEIGAIPLSFDISDLKSIPQKAKEALALL